MPDEIDSDSAENPSTEKPKKLSDIRLRLVFLSALTAAFVFFLCLYIFDRNPSKGLQLLTANILSLAVLVVICIQAYIYNSQRRHMEEQSGAMRKQLKVAQDGLTETRNMVAQNKAAIRAWLWPSKIELTGAPDSNDRITIFLKIENSGQTPAQNVRIYWKHGFFRSEPDAFPEIGEAEPQMGVIPGRQTRPPVSNGIEPSEGRQQGSSGRLPLYIWGRVEYRDVFEEERISRFAFVNIHNSKCEFDNCRAGNEMK